MNDFATEAHLPARVRIKRQRPARVPKDGKTHYAADDKL
jgi:hypothetical protein